MTAPITVKFSGFSGHERVLHVRHLGHREFFEILHTAIGVLASAFRRKGDKTKIDTLGIIKALDFNTFERFATKLLSGSVLEGFGQIEDPFEMQCFRDNPDELYLATYHALVTLHPDLFLKLQTEAKKMAGVASVPQAGDEGSE